ncbi:MAG: hypothetical protein HY699_13950 [Deltaproteobacteria bacterium]|nr:hypothetical protein [Deltaproteobacteria bacterium]
MSLLTTHKIFIAAAVLCFAGYSAWEIRQYANSAQTAAVVPAAAAAVAAIALSVYWRRLWRRHR